MQMPKHPRKKMSLLHWVFKCTGAVIKENFYKDKHVELKGMVLLSCPELLRAQGSMPEELALPAQG